jgi:hypothetical protein
MPFFREADATSRALREWDFDTDRPQGQDNGLGGLHYFRIAAPPQAEMVEFSVNEGPWLPCRKVAGYWVSDWSGYDLGKYRLRARMRTTQGGRAKTTLLRRSPGDFQRPLAPTLRPPVQPFLRDQSGYYLGL